jgi:hypothetical protein
MTKKVLQNLHTSDAQKVLINSKHVLKRELSQEARKLHVPGSVSLLSDTVQEKKSEKQKILLARTWEQMRMMTTSLAPQKTKTPI